MTQSPEMQLVMTQNYYKMMRAGCGYDIHSECSCVLLDRVSKKKRIVNA